MDHSRTDETNKVQPEPNKTNGQLNGLRQILSIAAIIHHNALMQVLYRR